MQDKTALSLTLAALTLAALLGLPGHARAQEQAQAPATPTAAPPTAADLRTQAARAAPADAVGLMRRAFGQDARAGDRKGQGDDLDALSGAEVSLARFPQAAADARRALALQRADGDAAGQMQSLNALGIAASGQSEYAQADTFYRLALARALKANNRYGQASLLNNLGTVADARLDYAGALGDYDRAARLYQALGDADDMARAIGNTADVYVQQSRYAEAVRAYGVILPVLAGAGDREAQARALGSRGGAEEYMSDYAGALADYRQELALCRQLGEPLAVMDALNHMADDEDDLGLHALALGDLRRALAVAQAAHDLSGEGIVLNNIAWALDRTGRSQEAVADYRRAQADETAAGDTSGLAYTVADWGVADQHLRRYADALHQYALALPLIRRVGDRRLEGRILDWQGWADACLGRYAPGTASMTAGLALNRQVGDGDGVGLTLTHLMLAWKSQNQPRLAIFYGKQAVNAYQGIRNSLQAMDARARQGYLGTVSDTYHTLADLLIGQGRLPEAEQVLAMLKGQEVTAFVDRDAALSPASALVSFDPDERAAEARYDALADPVTALGARIEALRAVRGRTPAQDAALVSLQNQLTPAAARFQAFLAALPQEMPASASPDQRRSAQAIQDSQGPMQSELARMGPGTVALFTLVEPDRYRVIVVTSRTEKAEQYPISADALRRLVFAWRAALQSPGTDPNVLGRRLSDILMGPIEADLVGAQAQTLLWSLDDALRYVPVAALYDGHHYLVEKYRTALFTGAALPDAGGAGAAADWQTGGAEDVLLALGVTQARQVADPAGGDALRFPALPGVDRELKDIARGPSSPGGVLPGTTLEDGRFTQASLQSALAHGYPVVHIASHFDLGASDRASFLLLGDGTVLSLADLFAQGGQVFQGVDLLTLSACQTGVTGAGGTGDGHEVESLASVAQQQGAASVLASLWPVSDATTPLLMTAFYRGLTAQPPDGKAEALRQAQLSLIHGTSAPPQSPSPPPGPPAPTRGMGLTNAPAPDADAPPFTPDPKAPYAHPYYWAPFVLIGGWR